MLDAALQQLAAADTPAQRIAALSNLLTLLKNMSTQAGAGLLPTLLRLLELAPSPDPSLFSDAGGSPTQLDAAAAAEAVAVLEAAAKHLQAAALLVSLLDAEQLGLLELLPAAPTSSGAESAGGRGGPIIEEIGSDGSTSSSAPGSNQSADNCITLILLAAQYGGDARLARPWADSTTAAAAKALLQALGAKWEAVAGAAHRQSVGQAALVPAASQHQSRGSRSLIAVALPQLLRRLQPVIDAGRAYAAEAVSRLEPFTGPDSFERCVVAGQLAWLARQLGPVELQDALPVMLPAVMACLEDPSPAAQACGLWALEHVATEALTADLCGHREHLLIATMRTLRGADDVAWPAAAAAAVAVVLKLEGSDPYSSAYEAVLLAFLEEGERSTYIPHRTAAWLAAAPQLFPALGLALVHHFGRLLPLLLGWCLAARAAPRCAALRALCQVAQLTWPRMPAHAECIWGVLERVWVDEAQHTAQPSREVLQAAARCGLALWHCGGVDFQHALLVRGAGSGGGSGGSGQADTAGGLLQLVMETVELESAAADGSGVAGGSSQAQQLPAGATEQLQELGSMPL